MSTTLGGGYRGLRPRRYEAVPGRRRLSGEQRGSGLRRRGQRRAGRTGREATYPGSSYLLGSGRGRGGAGVFAHFGMTPWQGRTPYSSPRRNENPDFDSGAIFFVGNATVLIRYAGFTILTDPNFLHAGDHVHLGYGLS